jgi:hypothetical protein
MPKRDRKNPQSIGRPLVRMTDGRQNAWNGRNPGESAVFIWNETKLNGEQTTTGGRMGKTARSSTGWIGWMPADGSNCRRAPNRIERRVDEVQSKRAKGSVRVGCCCFGRNGQLFRSLPALRLVLPLRATSVGRGKNLRRTATIDVKPTAGVERKVECWNKRTKRQPRLIGDSKRSAARANCRVRINGRLGR